MDHEFGNANIYLRIFWRLSWASLPLGFGLLILGASIFGAVRDSSFDALLPMALSVGILGAASWPLRSVWKHLRDLVAGTSVASGTLERKISWSTSDSPENQDSVDDVFEIRLERLRFRVSEALFDWLSEGDQVEVYYWPRIDHVARIEKVGVNPDWEDELPTTG